MRARTDGRPGIDAPAAESLEDTCARTDCPSVPAAESSRLATPTPVLASTPAPESWLLI